MNKEMVEFRKELDKLRKRGAIGINMFVSRNKDLTFSDYARGATKMIKSIKKRTS